MFFACDVRAQTADDLPALKIDRAQITAGSKVVHLRGINWGWWHLQGTIYTDADMQHLAQWGANVVRLPFAYTDLETPTDPPVWNEEGFRQIDQIAHWARKAGVYLVLDMHVVPGGQSTQPYCDHGRNLLWRDRAAQEHFFALWKEIARRYHGRTEIAAYELMNEPDSKQSSPDLLRFIDQHAISEIRSVDPEKIIVIGGDHGSSAYSLVDELKMADPNLLYTFHWYEGGDSEHKPIVLDSTAFRQRMSPAIAFADKFHVPVWVGEFGCEAANPAYQNHWVAISISTFEAEKFHWTYWNDKETTDPASMALQAETKKGQDEPINEELLTALRSGWLKNSLGK